MVLKERCPNSRMLWIEYPKKGVEVGCVDRVDHSGRHVYPVFCPKCEHRLPSCDYCLNRGVVVPVPNIEKLDKS